MSDEAWIAKPSGGKGRTIRAIVAHIHNVRLMWLKAAGAKEVPQKLDTEAVTRQQAGRALETSCRALEDMLGPALSGDGRIKGFKPDAAGFFAYLVAHDAHHRGQITMLARQMGDPVSRSAMFGMWEWERR